ncbi:MAG: hypothetical protein R3C99_23075 [Pirellulaceae bacterium]
MPANSMVARKSLTRRNTLTLLAFTIFGTANWTAAIHAAPFVPNRDSQCVSFSSDGRLVATGKSGMSNDEFPPRPHPTPAKTGVIQIWDARTGKQLRRMETFGDLRKVRFTPDARQVLSCRLYTHGANLRLPEVRLWDVETGKTVHVFDRCHDFSCTPDGRSVVVLSRSRCVLYDLVTLEKRRAYEPLGGAITVEVSPDGEHLAGIVPVDEVFEIRVVAADSGELLAQSVPLDAPFYSLAFAPDGQRLASGHAGGNIFVWDVATMRPAARFQAATRGIVRPMFSPDGEWLGGGCQDNGDVVIWELVTGKEAARFTHEQGTFHSYHPRGANERVRPEDDPERFVFAPTSDAYLCGCFGGIIRSLSGGQEVRRFRD